MSDAANLNDLLVWRHLRSGAGNDVAIIDDTGSWTYSELDAAADGVASLLDEVGIGVGDRIATAMADSRLWCATFLGVTRLGAICAPLEPGGRHFATILDDLEPAALCVDAPHDTDSPVRQIVLDGELDLAASRPHRQPVTRTSPAYIIYSSGSTGRPKGVVHAHGDLEASVEGYSSEVLHLDPDDRCLSVARVFASLGFGNGFFRPLGRGSTVVMTRTTPTVRRLMELVEQHQITVLTGVPTFWSQLARFLARHPVDAPLASVRIAVSSGDSLPAEVADTVHRLTGVDLVEGLGCSECSNIVVSTRPGERLPGRLGRPVSGVEIALRDDDGQPVAEGTPGRLWIRSPSNTRGYWRRPDETADVVHGDWIRMGDMLICEDGVYRHVGRIDDMFKVNALWVSPVEVEACLMEHPAVAEVAVVGVEDESGLTRVAAAVVLDEDVDPSTDVATVLRRHVAHRLVPHMAPSRILTLEDIPRGATGKLDRREVRRLLEV